jgi:small-conductance mechanosensitive channel/CRP-like cAMP-binding protein
MPPLPLRSQPILAQAVVAQQTPVVPPTPTDNSTAGPLLIETLCVPVLFLLLIFTGRWLKRRQGVQLGVAYFLFSAAAAVYLPLKVFHLEFALRKTVAMNLAALLLVSGAFVLIALVRRFFWELWFEKRQQTKAPKFVSEVFSLVLFLAAVLVALKAIYGLDIQGAVLGSTLVVGIIGFAMQDLLGNIIAGIAIEIGRPFRSGDWLLIEEGRRAEVVEVNWRSVRLRDNDDIFYDIPNKTIVGATIVNLTHPRKAHGIRLRLQFEYGVPPNTVKDMLAHAAQSASGVLSTPPVRVFLKEFGDSGITYEIRFFMENESRYNDILDEIRTNIWYEAQRNGLKIPFPIRTLFIERAKSESRGALDIARTSLRRQAFLQLLSNNQLEQLLTNARLLRFGRGEKIIEQGQEGRSMFILIHGEADVMVRIHDEEKHVATLRDGDYCGEMSLLTGEVRSATVQARMDCEMLEIGKETLAEILGTNTTLVERLSEILAKRKMEVDGIIEASMAEDEKTATVNRYKGSLLKRLYDFFEL